MSQRRPPGGVQCADSISLTVRAGGRGKQVLVTFGQQYMSEGWEKGIERLLVTV